MYRLPAATAGHTRPVCAAVGPHTPAADRLSRAQRRRATGPQRARRGAAPVLARGLVSGADRKHDARTVARPNDHVAGPGWAVNEVPRPQGALNALDDQQARVGEHQEVLLVSLPVIHRHRLSRGAHTDVRADLGERRVALELTHSRTIRHVKPASVAGVEYKPALARGHHARRAALELCFASHRSTVAQMTTGPAIGAAPTKVRLRDQATAAVMTLSLRSEETRDRKPQAQTPSGDGAEVIQRREREFRSPTRVVRSGGVEEAPERLADQL